MGIQSFPLYSHPDYPETFGDIVDWAVKRCPDPDKKVLFRLANTDIALTYTKFLNGVNQTSNYLHEIGVRKGDRVACFLPNCVEYAYLFHAISKCGGVIVPIIQFMKGEALGYIIEHSDSKLLVTTKAMFLDKIAPIVNSLSKVKTIVSIDEAITVKGCSSALFSQVEQYPESFEPQTSVIGSDIQGIWYTSGTTGRPKGVVISQKAYIWRALFFSNYFKLGRDSVNYYVLPMYHSGYAVLGTPLTMAGGGEIVQVPWFSASNFWPNVVKYKVTITASTGTVIPIMLKQLVTPEENEGKNLLKTWIGWPVGDKEVVKKRWPGIKFIEVYGTTEAPIAAVTNFDKPEIGHAGPVSAYTDLKLIDPQTGNEIKEANEVGEIAYKHKLGPDYIILEYYKDPKTTQAMIKNEYWHSGDLGKLDENGNLHFADRIKDYMRIGGENVSSAVVEETIRTFHPVAEVAIVAVRGELGHDEMVAHVVPKEGVTINPEEFFKFCNTKMTYFMVPKYLVIRSEIPKTGTLRVEKYKLREEKLLNATDRVKLGIEVTR